MRIEKEAVRMEYWTVIDDHWQIPVLVGIEHNGEEVHAIMVSNNNLGCKGYRTLGGAELLAALKAIEDAKVKIKDIDISLFYTT